MELSPHLNKYFDLFVDVQRRIYKRRLKCACVCVYVCWRQCDMRYFTLIANRIFLRNLTNPISVPIHCDCIWSKVVANFSVARTDTFNIPNRCDRSQFVHMTIRSYTLNCRRLHDKCKKWYTFSLQCLSVRRLTDRMWTGMALASVDCSCLMDKCMPRILARIAWIVIEKLCQVSSLNRKKIKSKIFMFSVHTIRTKWISGEVEVVRRLLVNGQ